MRTGLRPRVAVLVGIAVAAGVLASVAGARPLAPVAPADSNQAITAIRSSLEPAAFLVRPQSWARFSGKHSEGNGHNLVALAALTAAVALALGQLVVASQPRSGLRRQVERAWAQRAPPFFQHI